MGFSPSLQRAILLLVHNTKRGKIEELSNEICGFLRTRPQPNENVEVKVADGWQKATVLECPNDLNISLLMKQLKSPKTIDAFFSKESEHNKENGETRETFRSVLDRPEDELPDSNSGLFKIKVNSGKRNGEQLLVKGHQLRREKGFERSKMKFFLRQSCVRSDVNSEAGYWLVKKSEAAKHQLGSSCLGPVPVLKPSKEKRSKSTEKSIAELKQELKEKKESQKLKHGENEKNKEKDRERKEKEREKEKEKSKAEQEKKRALSLAEKEKLKEERERLKAEAEMEKRKKFMEKEQEKARVRDEQIRMKEMEKKMKKMEQDFLKLWNKPQEDLKLEDLQPLPALIPLKTRIDPDLVGDCLMLVEFSNTFGSLFEIEQEIDEDITLSWMEEALLEHDAEGNFYDMCKFLLHSYLRQKREEKLSGEESDEESNDEEEIESQEL